MNPGAKIVTAEGKMARVIWANEEKVGVFYLQERRAAYGVVGIDSITVLEDDSPFKGLSELSLDELKTRLKKVIEPKARTPKTKKEEESKELAELRELTAGISLEDLSKLLGR